MRLDDQTWNDGGPPEGILCPWWLQNERRAVVLHLASSSDGDAMPNNWRSHWQPRGAGCLSSSVVEFLLNTHAFTRFNNGSWHDGSRTIKAWKRRRMGSKRIDQSGLTSKDDQCEKKKPDDWTVNQDQNFGSASAWRVAPNEGNEHGQFELALPQPLGLNPKSWGNAREDDSSRSPEARWSTQWRGRKLALERTLRRELEDLNEEPRSKEDEQSQHNQGRQMQWEGHQMEYLYNYLSNNLAQWIQIRLRGCVINIQDLFDNVWRS